MGSMSDTEMLEQMHFEISGKVQGVYFRKHTQAHAKKHHLVGWVKNTHHGTVVGVAEGTSHNIAQLRYWLKKVGSPKSRIEKAVSGAQNQSQNLSTLRYPQIME